MSGINHFEAVEESSWTGPLHGREVDRRTRSQSRFNLRIRIDEAGPVRSRLWFARVVKPQGFLVSVHRLRSRVKFIVGPAYRSGQDGERAYEQSELSPNAPYLSVQTELCEVLRVLRGTILVIIGLDYAKY